MPAFKTLWDNFPDADAVKARCFNKQNSGGSPFDDYCAILLSECFIKSGISLNEAPPGKRCWSHTGAKHILLAEHLAGWLADKPPRGFGKKQNVQPGNFQTSLSGRTGVIFFKDFWQRAGQRIESRSGDHIDLWSKNRITGGSMLYRSFIEFLGLVST